MAWREETDTYTPRARFWPRAYYSVYKCTKISGWASRKQANQSEKALTIHKGRGIQTAREKRKKHK